MVSLYLSLQNNAFFQQQARGCNGKVSDLKILKDMNTIKRENFSSGATWEEIVGYSRVVKAGNMIWVSGTVAADEEGYTIGPDNAGEQTRYILAKIEKYLQKAGAELIDVVRTRIFVTDITRWKEIGYVHGEYFRDIRPATSMIEVKALISPEYLVEIEAEALIS
jgi:enamine deaminase RidA (YjgF/YER057c/UK114 family)